MMMKPIEVPFSNTDGNMMTAIGYRANVYTLKVVYPFRAKLTAKKMSWASRSNRLILTDEHGREWDMFESEWTKLFLAGRFNGTVVEGTWTVVKRGQSYGLVEYDDKGKDLIP